MESNLSNDDLQIILNIIDIASQRGAFRAQELSAIGALCDKIAQILNKKNIDNQQQLPISFSE